MAPRSGDQSDQGDRQRSLHSGRRRAERRGQVSEYLAAIYLMLKGYRILALRFRTRQGEIDIVARRKTLVVFVEVKARAREQDAIDAVSFPTQRRIRAASEIWMSKRRDAHLLTLRYDIIAIVPGRLPKHYPDAF